MNIGEYPLSLEDIEAVAVGRNEVTLSEDAIERIERAAAFVREMAPSGKAKLAIFSETPAFCAA